MQSQPNRHPAASIRAARAQAATIAQRVSVLWHDPVGQPPPGPTPDAGGDHRVEALEERTEHLEAVVEGLQDALYRRDVLLDEQIGELRRRIEPDQIARELSSEARRRGL